MTAVGYALFDTAIGRCGIGWSERGVVGVRLPERTEDAMRARLVASFPGAEETTAPVDVQRAIEDLASLLRGEPIDLTSVQLDMDGIPAFHRRVYAEARRIPPGSTVSYGEIARQLGDAGAARAVGQALGRNPFVLVVPCHRVLAAAGKSGGFSASGGVATKMRLLEIEGAHAAGVLPLFRERSG
jgi:methylated-DNA-[protein]-cysteine S-methyltransferase